MVHLVENAGMMGQGDRQVSVPRAAAGPLAAQGTDGLLACVVALLLAAMLLVACADRQPVKPTAVRKPAVARVVPPSVPETPIPKTKPTPPPAKPAAAKRPVEAQVAVLPAPVPPPAVDEAPRFDPAGLVGLTEQETFRLLGSPARVEENPPAKTWQYASSRCQLRVHLFMDMTTRSFRTLSYELSSTDEQPDVDQQCLAELVAKAWRPAGQ